METAATLEFGQIIISLCGGLALFLFGMDQMTDSLRNIAGRGMKSLLARLTTNRFKAVFAGTFVTAVIQSSSVTTVLVVGFITAGLLSLTQAIGIILGADIGTTITAQIVAFKVTKYALVLVAIGFAMLFIAKQKKVQQYGTMLMGLGLIFFGMELMAEATFPLRTYGPFIDLMRRMDNPLIGILVGTAFTAVIQSSSAMMGIIIVLASQGFVTLEAGIALAFGANIGTSVTAMLASIGKPREAVRAAVGHVLFKVIGVMLWFGFIAQLAWFVRWISPAAPADLTGTAKLAAEAPRQIANAHTMFNVVNTSIFVWFIHPFVRFLNFLIPERPAAELPADRPKYLDDNLLETPELALDRVRLELGRLGEYTVRMMRAAFFTVCQGTEEELTALANMDDDIDVLHGRIVTYLGKLSQENLLERHSKQLSQYLAAANNIENIGDLVEINLVETGKSRFRQDLHMSRSTQASLQAFYEEILWAVEAALQALVEADEALAQEVIAAKLEINQLAHRADIHVARRLIAAEPHRLDLFRLESEIIEYFKRVYYFAKRIAKAVVDQDLVYKQVDLREMTSVEETEWPEAVNLVHDVKKS